MCVCVRGREREREREIRSKVEIERQARYLKVGTARVHYGYQARNERPG